MGQALSDEKPAPPSREEITKALADKFAQKCFTSLELYSFKDVFNSLADYEHQVRYLKQDTIARFLEIPDALDVSAVLFQMVSFAGAFPFLDDAPAVLGFEQMVMVVTILTERYRRVFAGADINRRKLLFRSLAVYDRKLSRGHAAGVRDTAEDHDGSLNHRDRTAAPFNAPASGFVAGVPDDGEEGEVDDDDDDELVLAAFESLGYSSAFKHNNSPTSNQTMIPKDNLRRLIMLLLLIAPLDSQDSLSSYSSRLSDDELDNLKETANYVLASFLDVEEVPSVRFLRFNTVVSESMPFIFHGFTGLFEHFLFSKNLDFHRREGDQPQPVSLPVQPLLEDVGSIMNVNVLSQISFFIPGSSLFRKLRRLYSGDEDGFSMGSFESKVFNWRAPTILLVSGTRIPHEEGLAHSGPASAFLATLPSQRFPPGNGRGAAHERLTFGVYLSQPWRHTHRECFGTEDTVLFQLAPVHDVFRASTVNRDYAAFTKPSASTAPIGEVSFGCPPPQPTQAYRRSTIMSLGPVSLFLEDSFEFGCFTHDYTSQGGAFLPSATRTFDFQDRFEISSLEVWGCGGDEEAKHQAERWAWEAREAEARRKINLGTGDIEADRGLLEMAGLIGGNRSGGSMG